MPAARNPQPRWRVVLDGRDITGRIAPRLVSLTLTASRADDADQLDITLTDHDGRLALPRRGVTLTVALGWDDTGLVDKGTFTVDEVEHSGAPDVVTLRARSVVVKSGIREKREQSWHNLSVGDLVRQLAGRNGLAPRCHPSLAGIHVEHIDQTRESDMNVLTRIGRLFDAVATVKAGCLLFAPIGAGTTAGGMALPTVALVRADGDQHRYHAADRDAYTGVRAYWHDTGAAKRQSVLVGKGKDGGGTAGIKVLRESHATQADALEAAKAEWLRIQRGAATFALTLARGRPDVYPEMPARVRGWKPEIDANPWLVVRVEHALGDGGYTTQLELENGEPAAPEVDATDAG